MKQAINNRPLFSHHCILCLYGGFIVGMVDALTCWGRKPDEMLIMVIGWIVLGSIHGPLLWLILRRRPWWAISLVFSVTVVGAGVATAASGGLHEAFIIPLAALWFAAVVSWKRLPCTTVPGQCRFCDYDLRGLPVPICPECGEAFETTKGSGVFFDMHDD